MKTNSPSPPSWSTASLGDPVDTSPMELAALGHHLEICKGSNGHLLALQCAAKTMTGFATTRFVTTLLTFTLLISIVLLAL